MKIGTNFLLASFLMAFAIIGFSAISVNQASPAYASSSGCIAGSMNGCVSDALNFAGAGSSNQGVGNVKPQPGPSGKPKPAGSSKPVVIPCVSWSGNSKKSNSPLDSSWAPAGNNMSGCYPKYYTKSSFGGPGTCPVKTIAGFKIKAKGQIVVQVYNINYRSYQKPVSSPTDPPNSKQTFYKYILQFPLSRTCVYPKVMASTSTEMCALNVRITLDRTDVSRMGKRSFGLQPGSKTFATVSGLQNQTAKCVTSVNVPFTTTVENNERNWGQYVLDGKLIYANCYEGRINFDGKTLPSVYRCPSTGIGDVTAGKFTLWCGGKDPGWTSKKWDASDCGSGTGKFRHKCAVPKATFDGKTGTVQTLRDGKTRTVNWGTPKVTGGVRNVTNWRSYTRIVGGSTPLNRAASLNSSTKQYFSSDQTFNTWLKNDRTQGMGFYNASNPGGSFRMTRQLRFDAQFKVSNTKITGFNPWTGQVFSKSNTIWVTDKNIDSCAIQSSPSIQAIRSVGDAQ